MKYIRAGLSAAAFALTSGLVACNDDISVGKADGNSLTTVDEVYCRIENCGGVRAGSVEMRDEALTPEFRVTLSKAAPMAVDIRAKVDETLLDAYNADNDTAYEIYPPELVSLEDDGAVLIAPGDLKSHPVAVTLLPSESLEQGRTYVLPLNTEVLTEGVRLSADSKSYLLFVQVKGKLPSADKGTGIVTICYVECNSNNPLNAGEWTVRRSGKPLFDIVNLFAANIRYIEQTGRIGVKINPNIQYLLDHRDKYIQPLQDKGIKVCLTILGDHDGTGVANLSDRAAREFAAELRAIVDAYGLDGVDFDDEWSDYDKYPIRPGCVERGPYPYARLLYETKKAMPDKLCTLYYIGAVIPWPEMGFNGFDRMVDGVMPGDFIDYAYDAMYGSLNLEGYKNILGMDKRGWGPSSIEVESANLWNLDRVRNEGYGAQVVYHLRAADGDGGASYESIYRNVFGTIATKLYDDAVVFSGRSWHADWK